MQIACKLQCMNLSPWSMHSELFDIQGVCAMSALRGVHCTVLCVHVCVSVHQFTGALLSANICVGAVSPLVVTMTTALGCLSSSRVTS